MADSKAAKASFQFYYLDSSFFVSGSNDAHQNDLSILLSRFHVSINIHFVKMFINFQFYYLDSSSRWKTYEKENPSFQFYYLDSEYVHNDYGETVDEYLSILLSRFLYLLLNPRPFRL